MASERSKLVQALRRLLKERVGETEASGTLARFRLDERGKEHSDQAAALIAVALLEQALEDAIAVHLPGLNENLRQKVFEGDHEREGILGTVYTRAIVARALGTFGDDTLKDVLVLKDVRNLFAHRKRPASFETSPIPELCRFHVTSMVHAEAKMPVPDDPRANFLLACEWLISYLVLYQERRGQGDGIAWWKSFLT